MCEFNISEDGTLISCTATGKVVIPEGVTNINPDAFKKSKNQITEVIFPKTLKVIPANIFSHAKKLTKVVLNGTELIGKNAFYECRDLENVDFGECLKSIDDNAFTASALSEIVFPFSLEKIGNSAFENSYLHELFIPEKVNFIGNEAFSSNPIETVMLPQSAFFKESTFSQIWYNANIILYPGPAKDYEPLFEILFDTPFRDSSKISVTIVSSNVIFNAEELDKIRRRRWWEYTSWDRHNIKIMFNFIGHFSLKEKFLCCKCLGKCKFYEEIPEDLASKMEDLKSNQKPHVEDESLGEAEKLIQEIYRKSEVMSSEIQGEIKRRVKELIDAYEVELEKTKPDFNNDRINLTLSPNPESLKNGLIAQLDGILMDIETSINVSSKTRTYKEVLSNEESIYPESVQIPIDKLERIKFMISTVCQYFPKFIEKKDELQRQIEAIEREAVSNSYKKISIDSKSLELEIDKKIDEYYEKITDVYVFVMELMTGELSRDLHELQGILERLDNEDNTSYKRKLKELEDGFIKDIYSLSITPTSIKDFRASLQILLEELYVFVNNVSYQKQMKRFLERNSNENNISNPCTRVIKETIDDIIGLLSSGKLENSAKEKFKQDLQEVFNNSPKDIEESKDEYDENGYNILEKAYEILGELYSIKASIESYISLMEEYQKAKINI